MILIMTTKFPGLMGTTLDKYSDAIIKEFYK